MNRAPKHSPWSPSVGNALSTRETLVQLITSASDQVNVIGALQDALTAVSKSKNDETMLSICNALHLQISELYGIFIRADAKADTRVIVSGSFE